MPLYEYSCHGCGKTFEVRQKFADASLTVHPDCGGEVERLISVPTFQFKGTGWYVTDYGRGNGNGKSHDSNGSKAASESKTESKTEAAKSEKSEKSETKSETKPAPVQS